MDTANHTHPDPAHEDPLLHGQLATLSHFAPAPDFADRVMSQVWRPAPAWVTGLQNVSGRVFHRRRRWLWAGGLAAASTVSCAATIALAVWQWARVEVVSARVAEYGLILWRWTLDTAVRTAIALDASVWNRPAVFATAAIGAVAITLGCGWGLRRTLRQHQLERVSAHATV